MSAADWRFQTHVKKNDTCSHLLLRRFSGLKFLHNTVVYIMLKNAFQDVQKYDDNMIRYRSEGKILEKKKGIRKHKD